MKSRSEALTGAERRSLYTEGPSQWYGLLTTPQGEERAQAMLEHANVYSFFPVTKAKRLRRGKRVDVKRRYLPGYLFARFPGTPRWHRVLAQPFIRDVIRRQDGWPAPIAASTLDRIYAMRDTIEERDRAARTFRKGERARILEGSLEGEIVEFVEVRGSMGVFSLGLLGGARCEVALSIVEKANGEQ